MPRQRNVPSSGWYVAVEHDNGTTLTPRLRDDPQIEQQVNGLPILRVPVPRDEKWQAEGFEDAPVEAYQDGVPQPVDRLIGVEQTEKGTELILEGGSELKQRIQRDVDFSDAHVVARELVQSNTPYQVNVDDPAASTNEVPMQSADTNAEWRQTLNDWPPADDVPLTIENGSLRPQQTSFTVEAENAKFGNPKNTFTQAGASGGKTAEFAQSSQFYTQPFEEFSHRVPAGEGRANVRVFVKTQSQPEFTVDVDGKQVLNLPRDAFGNQTGWFWVDNTDPLPELSGTTTVKATVGTTSSPANDNFQLDLLNIEDARFSHSFPNPTSGTDYLSGPENFPAAIARQTEQATAINQVVGGRATVSANPSGGPNDIPEIELSNTQGTTYPISGSDTNSVNASFPSASAGIRSRLTLGRHGARISATPTTGFKPDRVDSVEIFADQDTTPVLVDRSFDDRLINVLQDIASENDFVFELRAVGDGPQFSFEMAQFGQRSTDADPAVTSFSTSKRTDEIIEKAVIKGGAQRVRQESFTSDHGSAVNLGQDNLIEGGEVVYDGGTQFDRGIDYQIDYLAGTITTRLTGRMGDNTGFKIDYDFKPVNSFAADGVSDPKTVVRSLPAIQSEQAAGQVAFILVNKFSDPVFEATVTIPDDAGWSVIDEIDPSRLPTDQPLQTQSIETSPGPTIIQLESQDSLSEVVSQIQRRLSQAETRV
jgi:hypothetical protein